MKNGQLNGNWVCSWFNLTSSIIHEGDLLVFVLFLFFPLQTQKQLINSTLALCQLHFFSSSLFVIQLIWTLICCVFSHADETALMQCFFSNCAAREKAANGTQTLLRKVFGSEGKGRRLSLNISQIIIFQCSFLHSYSSILQGFPPLVRKK